MVSIASVGEFIAEILQRARSGDRAITYRGHSDSSYLLRPSIFRTDAMRENEHILLRELIAAHPDDFNSDATALELLVRMQHYSLPTRLLDVSFNPLVALFFACESVKKRVLTIKNGTKISRLVEQDGEVVVMSVSNERVRYFDSDTVSCLANLARLRWDLKDAIDTSLELEAFNQSTPIKRLLHFIRQEKYGFEGEIVPSDIDKIFLVKPKQNNRRILAQAGAFFVFGQTTEINRSGPDGIRINHITVSGKSKIDILGQLDKLGINEKTLFPEIERTARYITGNISSAALARLLE